MIEPFLPAIAGGLCIGLASILLMALSGRIAGISGITWNALSAPLKNSWALLFVLGLILGAFTWHFLSGAAVPAFEVSPVNILIGGFFVGVGTKLGSGCTSGHGICWIGRLSVRSIVATLTFMLFGFITVYLRLHGGAA